MTRRSFFHSLAALPLVASAATTPLTPDRVALLDEIERRACRYFYEEAHPVTGLVRDRARTEGVENRICGSIAATGFGLSALCVADRRGYIDRGQARARVVATLTHFAAQAPHEQGFFYHFVDITNGQRIWHSELSSVDTAWLLCGILHCRSHFGDPEVQRLANSILDRVNWPWMLNGADTLAHGWTPENGFLPYRWDTYAELMAMYLLAIGSSAQPISPASWHAWRRPQQTYAGTTFIDAGAPLFVHQYSHAWFDFRQRRDRYADYFENSRTATQAHRSYCQKLAAAYPTYSNEMWGITASDSRHGYAAWGTPHAHPQPDGTVVPCAAGGSVAFLPDECLTVLETMLSRYGRKVWSKYGFVDAFHPQDDWQSRDVLGIDLGIMLLMAENLRDASVWKAIDATPEAERAWQLAGFTRS